MMVALRCQADSTSASEASVARLRRCHDGDDGVSDLDDTVRRRALVARSAYERRPGGVRRERLDRSRALAGPRSGAQPSGTERCRVWRWLLRKAVANALPRKRFVKAFPWKRWSASYRWRQGSAWPR
jgi:hypothetical protein